MSLLIPNLLSVNQAFLDNQGAYNAMLLREILFFDFYSAMQHFNRKSAIGVKFPRRLFTPILIDTLFNT